MRLLHGQLHPPRPRIRIPVVVFGGVGSVVHVVIGYVTLTTLLDICFLLLLLYPLPSTQQRSPSLPLLPLRCTASDLVIYWERLIDVQKESNK